MSGITKQLLNTLRCTTLMAKNDEQEIEVEFHIVPSDLLIVGDRILTDPFYRDHKIPIHVFGYQLSSAINGRSTISVRSEVIIPVRLVNKYPLDKQNALIYA